MQVTSADIEAISSLVIDLCGIYLDESKGYLIDCRLSALCEQEKCSNFVDLAKKIRQTNDRRLRDQVINAITTNETLFFRDDSPFEALKHKAIPESIDAKARTPFPRRLRIWSAAASTGQEAYSIAMTLMELIPDARTWDIQILGTDISEKAIERARLGVFAEHEVQRGLPPNYLHKYFTKRSDGWVVKDEVRHFVTFQRMNLVEPFAHLGKFDIIFCRNVAIYFTTEVRKKLFLRLAEQLTEPGYLFVGSSESLSDMGPRFTPQHHCRSIFYRPNMPNLFPVLNMKRY